MDRGQAVNGSFKSGLVWFTFAIASQQNVIQLIEMESWKITIAHGRCWVTEKNNTYSKYKNTQKTNWKWKTTDAERHQLNYALWKSWVPYKIADFEGMNMIVSY